MRRTQAWHNSLTIILKKNKIYAIYRELSKRKWQKLSQESKNTAENRSETSEKTAKNRDKTSKKSQKKLRFELDHSAKFYPIMSTKKAQSLFRISAIMTEEVDKDKLQIALNDVLPRFEAYKVRLKKGYAWHFFEYNDAPCKVFAEETLLKPINPADTNGYWFRVSALGNKIVLEIFHALADGNGALAFLKSIVKRYREVLGVNVEDEGVIDWKSQPHQEEIEDSFEKNYKPISLGQMNLKALAGKVPHRIKGTLSKDGYAVSEGVAEAQDVLKKAKEIGVSFTAYIAGVLAYSIEKTCKNKLPLAVMIPVNLRALYPSKTMRNFVTFVRIILAPNECKSIEECAKETQRQLKILSAKDKLDAFISTTVKAQKNWILKVVPLFLKTAILRMGRVFMRSRQTIIFSNLGNVTSPQCMGVERYALNMNVSKNNTQNLGAITTNGKTTLAFTRAIKETLLPETFFAELQKQNIAVKTND